MAASLVAGVLAIAAASVSPGSGRVALVGSGAESIGLSVTFTIAGVAVLGLVCALLAFRFRGRGERDGTSRESLRWYYQLVGLVTALALVGGVWAVVLLTATRRHVPPVQAKTGVTPPPPQLSSSGPGFDRGASVDTLIVIALCLVLYMARRLWRRRGRPGLRDLSPLVQMAAAGSITSPEASQSCLPSRGDAPLEDPRSTLDPWLSVVLAYRRFEQLMGHAGWPRSESETPLEYSARLGTHDAAASSAAPGAVEDLTRRFNSARYGHAVDERDRAAALSDLERLESVLREPA